MSAEKVQDVIQVFPFQRKAKVTMYEKKATPSISVFTESKKKL